MGTPKCRFARIFLPLMIALAGSACAPQSTSSENTVTHIAATPTLRGVVTPAPATEFLHPTSAKPITMTAGQPLNCAKGPHWILYDMVAIIQPGEVVTLTARSTADWPGYYFVRKSDGTECWAAAIGAKIEGDPLSLPAKEAPPLHEIYYQVENQTGLAVCDLLMRKPDEPTWGSDRLPEGAGAPGSTFGIIIMAGFYDVQILDCYGGKLYEAENTPIGPQEQSRNVKVYMLVTFSILNASGRDVFWIQYARHGEDSWQDITGMYDAALHDGATMYFTMPAGKYDFRAHDSYVTKYKLAFSAEDVAISPVGVTVTIK
jgi:hypothetical protein